MSDEGLFRIGGGGMMMDQGETTRTISNQQLTEKLVTERIKSEQHRLNYERLRCLYEK